MSFKDLAGSDTVAERAIAEKAETVRRLQAKEAHWADGKLQPWPEGKRYAQPVVGDFSPSTAGLAVLTDGAFLSGGPFDGIEAKVPRGAKSYDRPAASQTGFVPARYVRSAKRTEDGLAVFLFQAPEVISCPQ